MAENWLTDDSKGVNKQFGEVDKGSLLYNRKIKDE
jgi:hypothetical protein